jgi:hypothetical protein
MKRFVFIALIAVGITAFISGCGTCNPDGIKSETYTKKVSKTHELVIE